MCVCVKYKMYVDSYKMERVIEHLKEKTHKYCVTEQ